MVKPIPAKRMAVHQPEPLSIWQSAPLPAPSAVSAQLASYAPSLSDGTSAPQSWGVLLKVLPTERFGITMAGDRHNYVIFFTGEQQLLPRNIIVMSACSLSSINDLNCCNFNFS